MPRCQLRRPHQTELSCSCGKLSVELTAPPELAFGPACCWFPAGVASTAQVSTLPPAPPGFTLVLVNTTQMSSREDRVEDCEGKAGSVGEEEEAKNVPESLALGILFSFAFFFSLSLKLCILSAE